MDAITILRLSYHGASTAVLLTYLTPPLRDRFLSYGARSSTTPVSSAERENQSLESKKNTPSKNILTTLLDALQGWQVPHDWFWTFYALSVTLSAFWAGEALLLRGPLYELMRDRAGPMATNMTFEQVKVTWIMMLVQGGRRLYESLVYVEWEEFGTDKKMSMMWGGHWVMGMAFYMATSVAFWIEGIPAIENHKPTYGDFIFQAPTFRTIFAVLLFMLASGFQHDCHSYLAYLKRQPAVDPSPPSANTRSSTSPNKASSSSTPAVHTQCDTTYKLPTHPAFQPLISPHYTAEVVIYLALAIQSAPPGRLVNGTMANALVFVVVNLGVTADGTREWYERKFGPQAVEGKSRMLPGIW
ncbi:uncharacterized protein LTR77_002468 [Saxophila tyrrhenica]|uniref:Polyprenal reductase n=1 Tax=Saxophila tyrrhenica TaxID=1690608 RepID=A0AAV9PL98_9PEZI|nr:hypothetical protein LTR77_002468 [Saxophila tyrrhenica]